MLSQLRWMEVPVLVRIRLAQDLGLKKSGCVVSEGTKDGLRVLTDGYTGEDLLAITIEKLQEYVGSEGVDFYLLWDRAVAKATEVIENEVNIDTTKVEPKEQMYVMLPAEEAAQYREDYEKRKEVYIKLRKPEDILPKTINAKPKKNAKKKK